MKRLIIVLATVFLLGCATAQPKSDPNVFSDISQKETNKAVLEDGTRLFIDIGSTIGWLLMIH